MGYQLIRDDGHLIDHNGEPNYQRLTEAVDDKPVPVPLPDAAEALGTVGRDLIAWVGSDYVGHEIHGEIQRNIPGSILLWLLGAPRQPYGGTIAITGVTSSLLLGQQPIGLDPSAVTVIRALHTQIVTITGTPRTTMDTWLTDRYVQLVEDHAREIADMDYLQLAREQR